MQDEQQQQTAGDDVDAHGARFNGAPEETADVEAHRKRFHARDEDSGPPGDASVSDADDDVEAHRRRFHG